MTSSRGSEETLRVAESPNTRGGVAARDEAQALPLFVALIAAACATAAVLFAVAEAAVVVGHRQSTADIAALSGAAALRDGLDPTAVRAAATGTAGANNARAVAALIKGPSGLPRVKVTVTEPLRIGAGMLVVKLPVRRSALAEVRDWNAFGDAPGPGDYRGPLASRQGKPMRPDVALAFDRMAAAATLAGHPLTVVSGWRSSAEQARLFAAHPDPRWVAPPGRSLHRLGTELDLGPPGAWPWLAANCGRFGFLKRYPWEAWHFGYTRSPGSTSVGWGLRSGTASRSGALPAWVPVRYRQQILDASIRWGVSATVLAAQIRAESDFQPRTVSSAGARGISQLMPEESRRFHVDPFDPGQAIGAQARLMRELLGRFGSVPLALAAYNAGAGAVARCGCIPPYAETKAYVARILGWLSEAGYGRGGPSLALVE